MAFREAFDGRRVDVEPSVRSTGPRIMTFQIAFLAFSLSACDVYKNCSAEAKQTRVLRFKNENSGLFSVSAC